MTYESLYNQVLTDWCNRLDITVADAGFDMIVISKIIAAGLFSLTKIIDNLKNNVWVGSMQAAKLLEVGPYKIGRGLYEAVKGEYRCTTVATGEGDIEEGTIFTKEINGTLYKYESIATVEAGEDITVRALTAGTASALIVTDKPEALQQLTYAESTITVVEITETPLDAETIEHYRSVVVAYERLRLGNGNASDYILWVSNVNGLRTGYPYTAPGEAGKAVIYCESSDIEVLVPGSSLIDDAVDAIKYDSEGVSQPPVEFFEFINDTYVLPVQITGVKLVITNGEAGEQEDIEDLIRNYLLIKRPFLHTVNKYVQYSEGFNTLENTIALVDIVQVLANAAITFDSVDMQVNVLLAGSYVSMSKYVVGYRAGSTFPTTPSPGDDPALPAYYGECPRLENITFV